MSTIIHQNLHPEQDQPIPLAPPSGTEPVKLGLIGAGAFGAWSLGHYASLPWVKPVAVADAMPEAAQRLAARFGIEPLEKPNAMIEHPEVELIHLATPPATHHAYAIAAAKAGKHVLCEKPLAMSLEEADEMVRTAVQADRLLVANLVMPYNRLNQGVRRILLEKLLGEPMHAFFENYAKDEPLGPDHWFWDRRQSGGIFVEHGVHFFDLFSLWFGRGKPIAAQQTLRPGRSKQAPPLIEQAQATIGFGPNGNVLSNFYHGFHQASRLDRQEIRIICERGDIRLFDWVPTSARVHGVLTDAQAARVAQLLPASELTRHELYEGQKRRGTARHKPFEVDGKFTISSQPGLSKDEVYGQMMLGMLADQARAVRDPQHRDHRRVREDNGVESLRLALESQRLADETKVS